MITGNTMAVPLLLFLSSFFRFSLAIFFPSLSLSLPPTHLLSPESKCHSVAQPLSSLCCTLTLLHISSY